MNAWRRSRFFRFDVAVVSIVATLIVALVLASTGGGDPPRPSADATVTVDPGALGPVVPAGFLGLSIEYPALEAYAGTDPSSLDPVFEQLVRNLAPGQAPVLRIGGNSADRTWWPTAGMKRPPGVTFDITDQWLGVTRALAQALGAHLILGLNLEADSPQLAASEARALIDGVGARSVRALELGNEPDLYPAFPWYRSGGHAVFGRPKSYDESAFIRDFAGLTGALPDAPLAGPSLSGMMWTRDLGQFLAAEPHLGLVTLHRYPLQLCLTPPSSARYPTIARLLSPATSTGLAESFAPYVALARAHGLSLRVDELNSVSCGADPAVSKSFASALWALRTLFEMARVGVSGVNIHTFPGAGYELFDSQPPGRSVAGGGLARVLRPVDVRSGGAARIAPAERQPHRWRRSQRVGDARDRRHGPSGPHQRGRELARARGRDAGQVRPRDAGPAHRPQRELHERRDARGPELRTTDQHRRACRAGRRPRRCPKTTGATWSSCRRRAPRCWCCHRAEQPSVTR